MPFAAGANPFTQIRRDMAAQGKQMRFGLVLGLTRTAQEIKAAEVQEIGRAFDRPTPYTLNAVFVDRATTAKPVATVGLKDDFATRAPGTPPVNYLGPNIEGGGRRVKRFEQSLTLAGHLPGGWQTVPGAGARLDNYGNLSRGQIIQILSQLRITIVAGFTRNLAFGKKGIAPQRKAGGRFFVVKPGGKRQPGVYQREFFGRNVTPVVIFVKRTSYRRRFDWEQVAERVINARLDANIAAGIAQAQASAGNNRFLGESDLARSVAGSISFNEAGRR